MRKICIGLIVVLLVFVFEDKTGVGDLDCPFGMERVPRLSKC